MEPKKFKKIYEAIKSGKLGADDAMRELGGAAYEDIGFAKFDTQRALRRGFPEVIFCRGKSMPQIEGILKQIKGKVKPIVLTKADKKIYRAVKKIAKDAEFYEKAGIIVACRKKQEKISGRTILVITAGTADLPVAEEAAVMAEVMGNKVERLYDVGVAGIHRLFDRMDRIRKAGVLIVVAGMEGALPSVISGMVDKPVIAVPTSIGYGASFKGIAPLLTMLNSCSPGIAVVNIDNGFGAGYLASIILRV